MSETQKIASVFGATGFLGRLIVRDLAKKGYTVKAVSRVPESAFFLRPCGHVGQIVPFGCDYKNPASLGEAVRGADVVINCIGILYERKKGEFEKIHAELPGAIAAACAFEKVKKFIHISALGVDKATSRYAKTKLAGEKNAQANFPKAVIFRPSVMFGEDDRFFNRFAELAEILPAMMLVGGGETKFQPVYAGDVAAAAMAALDNKLTAGQVFELGGPDVVTLKEIFTKMFSYTYQSRMLVKVPFGIAKIQACFMALLPDPVLTPDQVESLKTDSVVAPGALTLKALSVTPTAMDVILPTYLSRYRPGGRFAVKKAA